MPTFLVESYAAYRDDRLDAVCERARLAAALGTNVDYVRTTFLPEDEVVLHVFEAGSSAALHEAVGLAKLDHERIVEAVEPSDDPAQEVRDGT